ncbi:hypothetical protein GF338_04220 [candidate division WOR-3 bacterium]|nr:hypothetical protein [candidate division WOR-3 bacterium]
MSLIQDEVNEEKPDGKSKNPVDSAKHSHRGERQNKIAVVGAGTLMRGIIRGVMWITGRLRGTRFFDSEAQALAWVREEIN